MRVRTADPW